MNDDFGTVIDATIAEHRAQRVDALFLWPLVAWTVLGFGAIAYAAWWASR
jgi:hypothetical protein